MLEVRVTGNRFSYSLARPAALRAFVGELPVIRPPWRALLTVTAQLVALERRAAHGSATTLPVEAAATLERLRTELAQLALAPPAPGTALPDRWPAVQRLGTRWLVRGRPDPGLAVKWSAGADAYVGRDAPAGAEVRGFPAGRRTRRLLAGGRTR